MVSSIMPATNDNRAAMTTKPHTMRVGNLSTKPVFMYSIKIGAKNMAASIMSSNDNTPKNLRGL